jgi:hypothetical protein
MDKWIVWNTDDCDISECDSRKEALETAKEMVDNGADAAEITVYKLAEKYNVETDIALVKTEEE